MGAGGDRRVIDAGGDLDAERLDVLSQCQHPAERRRPPLGVGDATPVGPSRRIGEDGIDTARCQIEVERVVAHHLDVGEGHEIDCRQRRGRLVALDGQHLEPEARQCHRVPADAAAQVGHAMRPGAFVSGGVVGRDR